MPRKNRQVSKTGVYHFINRGVNKKKLFHRAADYDRYLALVSEHAKALDIHVHHYCLMNNHTHLLLTCPDLESLSRFAHYLQRRYAYYYCKTYRWAEQVFRKRFVSIPIEKESYLLECGRYIERNPVRAGLIKNPKDFLYSSFMFYGFGLENPLLTPNPLYLEMGSNPARRKSAYRKYAETERPYEKIVDKALIPF